MKKTNAVLFSLLMLVSSLAGCLGLQMERMDKTGLME